MAGEKELERAHGLLEEGQAQRALEILSELIESREPASRIPALDLASQAAYALGRLEDAGMYFRRLRDGLKDIFGQNHPHVAAVQQNMARLAHEQGRLDEALILGREALGILLEALGSEHVDVAQARLNLSTHWYGLRHYDEAEQELREAMRVWEAQEGRRSPHVATCLNNLGRLYEERGDLGQGVAFHTEAVSIRREILGDHPDTAFSLGNLGVAQLMAGDFTAARQSLEEALACYERLGLGDSPDAAAYRANLDICSKQI